MIFQDKTMPNERGISVYATSSNGVNLVCLLSSELITDVNAPKPFSSLLDAFRRNVTELECIAEQAFNRRPNEKPLYITTSDVR